MMPAPSTRPVAFLTLLLSLGLLATAVPYALGFAQVLRYQPALDRLQAGHASPDLAPLVRAWDRAVVLFPDPRLASDRALLRLAEARLTPDTPARMWQTLAAEYDSLLNRRPFAPMDWARLAYVATRAGDTAHARTALEQSFRTGRYLPTFLLWRYTLALPLLDDMTEAQRAQLGDQTGILLRKKRWELIRMARLAPFSAEVEELIRTYHPSAAEEFLRRRGPLRMPRQE